MSSLAQSIARCWMPVACVAVATFSVGAHAATFTENFSTGTSVLPTGWTTVNNSLPLGTNTAGWATGGATAFVAQDGSAGGFAYANFNAGAGTADISAWFYTPALAVSTSSVLSFWTRTASGTYPDRLEVRWSAAATPSAGTGSAAVGTFTTLLLSVNPNLTTTGYPTAWTNYTAAFSSLVVPTTGNIAFRYCVTNGGPDGANSNFIGIDTISVTNVSAVPEPGTAAALALGLGALVLRRRRLSLAPVDDESGWSAVRSMIARAPEQPCVFRRPGAAGRCTQGSQPPRKLQRLRLSPAHPNPPHP